VKLKELLDLKQKHANVEEARAGVREAKQAVVRAEEANKILAATQKLSKESALQTIQGSKQNRSLMIFTIVTIIFVRIRKTVDCRVRVPSADKA
jgi:Mg2+ and Co2+ transporter CorA